MAQNLSKPISLQTAFGEYRLDIQLGEGGAGRVFGGIADDGSAVAVKVLTQTSSDKRRRFKNEISFLANARHPNLVPVSDYGVANEEKLKGPFYVMPRYRGSLRDLMKSGLPSGSVMELFSQILDGVEAAHLLGVTHRDLKPENVLMSQTAPGLAIADFGIASFTAEQLVTMVETGPTQRLANFLYAAPEQRSAGSTITSRADIYALGLMLNELFTGTVPHGTSYKLIGDVAEQYGYLDRIVGAMISQNPQSRPGSIQEVKSLIQKYNAEAVSLQRLSELNRVVIPAGQVDEPLAHQPPKIVGADWDKGTLVLTLDKAVNNGWVEALRYRLGGHTAVMGAGPQHFQFSGNRASVSIAESSAQNAIDHFKEWLPRATQSYRRDLEEEARGIEERRRQKLEQERLAEETRLRVNSALRF